MVIIDTSVVFKWLIDEGGAQSAKAEDLLSKFLHNEIDMLAPDILQYEIGNVLSTKRYEPSQSKEGWALFLSFHIPLYRPDGQFIETCIDFSIAKRVSLYDSAFAVLAREKKATLITADKKLVDTVNESYVQLL